MVKRGKLSKVETYYIEGNTSLPVADIAKELDRSEAIVQKTLDAIAPTEEAEADAPVISKDEPRMLKAVGRHQRNGETVAVVMTEAASSLADTTRPARTMNKKLQNAIHKPRG